MTTQLTMSRLIAHADSIKSGTLHVSPGQPFRFGPQHQAGDGTWQGDLGIELVDAVPDGWERVEHPTDDDRRMVPGTEDGARHILDSLHGVTLYRRADWGVDSLHGPVLVLAEERMIEHHGAGRHGTVHLVPGIYLLRYQRSYDAVQRSARRTID